MSRVLSYRRPFFLLFLSAGKVFTALDRMQLHLSLLWCGYCLWLSWVNSYFLSQNFSVSTRGPIYPLLFKRWGLHLLFPRIARISLLKLMVFTVFQPFLHLHLPVLISPSGEDPSSYQGALARVVTSFASEKLLSSLLSKLGAKSWTKVESFELLSWEGLSYNVRR